MHNCPCTGEVCVLVIKNELHFPSIGNDLILHFIKRVGIVAINDVPKIHCEDPMVDDHIVSFDKSDLQIPLQLNGVFSCFNTRVPTERELHECEKTFLAPDSSN